LAQLTGVILGRPESTTGTGKTGRSWTQHKYTVLTEDGKRSMTTFDNAAFGEIKEGQTYKLTYTEKPNPKSPQYPYLNLEAWVLTDPIEPKQVSRGDFLRSREQCTMENMIIATSGDWDASLTLYEKLAEWETARVAGAVNISPIVVEEPVVPEASVTTAEPSEATVDAESTLVALKALSAARFKDGVEVLNVAKLKALCAKTYKNEDLKGKNLRELNIEELHSLTKTVEVQVEELAGE